MSKPIPDSELIEYALKEFQFDPAYHVVVQMCDEIKRLREQIDELNEKIESVWSEVDYWRDVAYDD